MSFNQKELSIIKALDARFAYLHSKLPLEGDVDSLADLDIPKTLKQRGQANYEAAILVIGNAYKAGEDVIELTQEEILRVKRYTGWGGFEVQDSKTTNIENTINYWAGRILKDAQLDILKPVEGSTVDPIMGVLNEYYTPYWLTYSIAKIVKEFEGDFKKNKEGKYNLLETSAGVGRFLQPFSPSKYQFHAVEPTNLGYELLSKAYPSAKTYNSYFERFVTSTAGTELFAKFSLVVSNPPYGIRIVQNYDEDTPKTKSKIPFKENINYFLYRSMTMLHEKGIGAFVVTGGFMTSQANQALRKEFILQNHLIGAIKLPQVRTIKGRKTPVPAIFEGTDIDVDVIFVQRRKGMLKTPSLTKYDNRFIEGKYFADNRNHVIGKYENFSSKFGDALKVAIDYELTSLPNITIVDRKLKNHTGIVFLKMKEYGNDKYEDFSQTIEQKGKLIQVKFDPSNLSVQAKIALKVANQGSEFLEALSKGDISKAKTIQPSLIESYNLFRNNFKTTSAVNQVIKGLEKAGLSSQAYALQQVIQNREKIKQPIDMTLAIPEEAKTDLFQLTKALLKNSNLTNKDVTIGDVKQYYKSKSSPLIIFNELSYINFDGNHQFAFSLGSDKNDPEKIIIYDASLYFIGLLWGKYDKINKDIKFCEKKSDGKAGIYLNLMNHLNSIQKPQIEKNLGMVTSAYLLSNDKTSPRDVWIPVEFINSFFKQRFFYDNQFAQNYNVGRRSRNIFLADDFDLIRIGEFYYLKTLSKLVFTDSFENVFLKARFNYFEKIYNIVEDKYKESDLYRVMKAQMDKYMALANRVQRMITVEEVIDGEKVLVDKPMKNKKGESKTETNPLLKEERELIEKSTKRFYDDLIRLIKKDDRLTKEEKEKVDDFIVPVSTLVKGDIYDPQKVFLGYVAISKSQFNPSFSESKNAIDNEENTKLDATEDRDEARLRLVQEYQKQWNLWLGSNISILDEITDVYNRKFKGYKIPELDGSPIDILGYKGLPLRPYQNSGVRKLVQDNGGLLALDVGLGKTFTGICTIGLMKQNGKAQRPILVVPKSLIWQWYKNIGICFPDWNVGIVGETLNIKKDGRKVYSKDTPKKRGQKYVDLKLGLYDCLIVPYQKLETSKLSQEMFDNYVEKIFNMKLSTVDVDADNSRLKAQLKDKEEFKTKLRASIEPSGTLDDTNLTWEDIGVDCILVDEAQNFKNLHFPDTDTSANVKYLGIATASKRAYHLDMRCEEVRKRNGAIILLSATPAKNSPIEFYNMVQYIDPSAYSAVPSATHYMQRYLRVEQKRLPTTNLSSDILPYVAGFQNLDEFRDIIARFAMFETLETINEKYGKDYPNLMESLKIPKIYSKEDDPNFTPYIILDPTKYQDDEMLEIIEAGDENTVKRTKYWKLIEKRNELRKAQNPSAEDVNKLIALELLQRLNAVALHPVLNKTENDIGDSDDESSTGRVSKSNRKNHALKVVQQLIDNNDLYYPKFTSCAKNVLEASGENGCGHIIFVENILAHYIMKEVLIRKANISPERIALMNGLETSRSEERTDVANKFNGDEKQGIKPEYDIIIANSIAYEGIDLQARTCMIHHLDLGWEAATIQQRNGRGVRQGNRFSIIKIYYYLIKGSSDTVRLTMIQQKRNWLIDAVKSQDVASNNPLADDLSIDIFMLKTLRDPEALQAELKEREYWQKFDDYVNLCQKRAYKMASIRSAYKMAQYSLSIGNKKRYDTQIQFANHQLDEFKKNTPIDQYPFAQLADMLEESDVYIVPNSPIGEILIEGMVWSVSIPNAPFYYAYCGRSGERRSNLDVVMYGQLANNSWWDTTVDFVTKLPSVILLTSSEMDTFYARQLGRSIDDLKLTEFTKFKRQAIKKVLIDGRALNLDQNQKIASSGKFSYLQFEAPVDIKIDTPSEAFSVGSSNLSNKQGDLKYWHRKHRRIDIELGTGNYKPVKSYIEESYIIKLFDDILSKGALFRSSYFLFDAIKKIPNSMYSLFEQRFNMFNIIALRLFLVQNKLDLSQTKYIPFIDLRDDKLYFVTGDSEGGNMIPYFGTNVKKNLNLKDDDAGVFKLQLNNENTLKTPIRTFSEKAKEKIEAIFFQAFGITEYQDFNPLKWDDNEKAYRITMTKNMLMKTFFKKKPQLRLKLGDDLFQFYLNPRIIKIIPMEARGMKTFVQYLNADKFGGIIKTSALQFPFAIEKSKGTIGGVSIGDYLTFISPTRNKFEIACDYIATNYFRQSLPYKIRLKLKNITVPKLKETDE